MSLATERATKNEEETRAHDEEENVGRRANAETRLRTDHGRSDVQRRSGIGRDPLGIDVDEFLDERFEVLASKILFRERSFPFVVSFQENSGAPMTTHRERETASTVDHAFHVLRNRGNEL